MPSWLHIPGCLALGAWSHHCDYLGREDLFCTVLLCILATSSNLKTGKLKVKDWVKTDCTNNQWNMTKVVLISDKVSHIIILPEGKKEKETIGSVEVFENIITKNLLK